MTFNMPTKFNPLGKTLFAFFLLTFAFGLSTKAQTETPPAPSAPRAAQIPKPVEKTLKNGLRVIVVERKNVPLVTAQLLIKSGGEVDPANLAGAADMTAELLTKGTKTRTATQIAQEIEFLGGSIESGAAWDASNITVRVMSDKLDKAAAIMADAALNPTFAQEEIDRYKTQVLDELEVNLKQPGALAGFVANRVVFGDAPYGHPLAGTPESIKRISRNDLINLHKNIYTPDNAVLVIAGDIAPDKAFAIAESNFGKWTGKQTSGAKVGGKSAVRENSAKFIPAKSGANVKKITVVDLPDSGQAAVYVAVNGIERQNKDYYQGIVANSVFGGGYSARLNQEVRIKRGLSYGARSDLQARRAAGVFLARTQTKNESAAEVAQLIVDEIARLGTGDLAETELTPRKAVLTGDFARDLGTTNGLVERIGELAVYGLDLNEINNYIQNVTNISSDQARTFARTTLGAGANVIIVGDAKKFMPELQKRLAGVEIETIPISELDLNAKTLRKAKTSAAHGAKK